MALYLPPPPQLPDSASTALSQLTTYHCTASRTCKLTTTTYETWVAHELTAHPQAHDLWYCHTNASLPTTPACNIAFTTKGAFEEHFFATHPKDEVGNWRSLDHAEFYLGPDGSDGEQGRGELFWCGFCRRVWACSMTRCWRVDRFEHVAGHFERAHARLEFCEIGQWEWVEVSEAEGCQAPVGVMVIETAFGGNASFGGN